MLAATLRCSDPVAPLRALHERQSPTKPGNGLKLLPMILVIPQALPPAGVASALVDQLEGHTPTLLGWLSKVPSKHEVIHPDNTLCTPYQAWTLQRAGFTPEPDQPWGAGWAVLAADALTASTPNARVWLAHFVHFAVSQHGVSLADPASLDLDEDDAQALLEAALPELSDAGIRVERRLGTTLQLTLPNDVLPYAPTLEAAIGQEVERWWPHHAAARPWRRVLNAVQMVWHNHPVNQRRAQQGKLEINGLWLHGGGRPDQFDQPTDNSEPIVEAGLVSYAQQGDWGSWLQTLAVIEEQHFKPLQRRLAVRELRQVTLVLTGADRLVTLRVDAPRGWARWVPRRTQAWRAWWAPPLEPPRAPADSAEPPFDDL